MFKGNDEAIYGELKMLSLKILLSGSLIESNLERKTHKVEEAMIRWTIQFLILLFPAKRWICHGACFKLENHFSFQYILNLNASYYFKHATFVQSMLDPAVFGISLSLPLPFINCAAA